MGTQTHTLSSSSNADGYTPPPLAALDLQWPVSLQLLMPRGACFTALPQGPNRLSISRWAAALFPINSPVQAGCRHPGAPSLEGGERRWGGPGKKGRGGIMLCCWATELFKGLGTVTSFFLTYTDTHTHTHVYTHGNKCSKVQIVCTSFLNTIRVVERYRWSR